MMKIVENKRTTHKENNKFNSTTTNITDGPFLFTTLNGAK